MTPTGIELATYRFVAQHLNHCATAVPSSFPDSVSKFSLHHHIDSRTHGTRNENCLNEDDQWRPSLVKFKGRRRVSSPVHIFTSQRLFGAGKNLNLKLHNFVPNVCFVLQTVLYIKVLKHELSENNVPKFSCFRENALCLRQKDQQLKTVRGKKIDVYCKNNKTHKWNKYEALNLIVAPCNFVESLQFINQQMHIQFHTKHF